MRIVVVVVVVHLKNRRERVKTSRCAVTLETRSLKTRSSLYYRLLRRTVAALNFQIIAPRINAATCSTKTRARARGIILSREICICDKRKIQRPRRSRGEERRGMKKRRRRYDLLAASRPIPDGNKATRTTSTSRFPIASSVRYAPRRIDVPYKQSASLTAIARGDGERRVLQRENRRRSSDFRAAKFMNCPGSGGWEDGGKRERKVRAIKLK